MAFPRLSGLNFKQGPIVPGQELGLGRKAPKMTPSRASQLRSWAAKQPAADKLTPAPRGGSTQPTETQRMEGTDPITKVESLTPFTGTEQNDKPAPRAGPTNPSMDTTHPIRGTPPTTARADLPPPAATATITNPPMDIGQSPPTTATMPRYSWGGKGANSIAAKTLRRGQRPTYS